MSSAILPSGKIPSQPIPLDMTQAVSYYLRMKSLMSDLVLTVLGVVLVSAPLLVLIA